MLCLWMLGSSKIRGVSDWSSVSLSSISAHLCPQHSGVDISRGDDSINN